MSLCFNEIAAYVSGCEAYLRQRKEVEGVLALGAGATSNAAAARTGKDGSSGSSSIQRIGGGSSGGRGRGGVIKAENMRSASVMSMGGMSTALGSAVGRRKKGNDARFTEVRHHENIVQRPSARLKLMAQAYGRKVRSVEHFRQLI